MFLMLKGRVGAVIVTHTHIGTDDLEISDGTCYLTDIGLSGCMDNVIGMEEKAPILHMLTGLKHNFDVKDKCKKIFQALLLKINSKKTLEAKKLKAIDDKDIEITQSVRNKE